MFLSIKKVGHCLWKNNKLNLGSCMHWMIFEIEGWVVGDHRGCGHATHVPLNVDRVTGIRI